MTGERTTQIPLCVRTQGIAQHTCMALFHSSCFARCFRINGFLTPIIGQALCMMSPNSTMLARCGWQKKQYLHNANIQPMKPIPVLEPFSIVGMDVLGPLLPTINGHKYIVIAIDSITKWVGIAIPLSLKCNGFTKRFNCTLCAQLEMNRRGGTNYYMGSSLPLDQLAFKHQPEPTS